MKNILVPTDFSVHSTRSFVVASTLAKQLGYGITLYTSLTPQLRKLFVYAAGASKYSEAEVQEKELETYINEKLSKLTEDKVFKGVNMTFKVAPTSNNEAAEHIVSVLNPKEYAMVVINNQGSKGKKVTVADLVIRNCDFPVVSVLDTGGKTYKVKKMLFFTDFEYVDNRFVLYLKKLQKAFSSKLIVGHVVTESDQANSEAIINDYNEFVKKQKLDKVSLEIFNAKELETGMITLANNLKVDLVCMGTHGRKGLSRLFKGNVAEDFINHVSIPTLVYNESAFYREQYASGEAAYGKHAYTRGFSG
jgi:nucleotide-binding universal stress UspA family protein